MWQLTTPSSMTTSRRTFTWSIQTPETRIIALEQVECNETMTLLSTAAAGKIEKNPTIIPLCIKSFTEKQDRAAGYLLFVCWFILKF